MLIKFQNEFNSKSASLGYWLLEDRYRLTSPEIGVIWNFKLLVWFALLNL